MRHLVPVLVVDGDPAYRRHLASALTDQGGMDIVEAGSIAEADSLIAAAPARFKAMIMDVELPDGCGRAFCRTVRTRYPALPVMFLTDRDDDVAAGLESGASDFVRKPVRSRELAARLRAHRRSVEMSFDASAKIGPFTFRPGQRSLFMTARNQRIWLTTKEVGILRCLLGAAGAPVPRDALLMDVWGLSSGAPTHTLETHIYRLRQKLGDEGLLVTGRGGYQLAA